MDDSPSTVLDLRLLEHGVRLVSAHRRYLDDLARCFDVDRPPAQDLSHSIHLRVHLRPRTAAGFHVTSRPDSLDALSALRTYQPTTLASALNLWAVRESRRYYVFHAGGVARAGRGILLPAPSHGGKSTLTAALLLRGFDLLSDEVGAVEMTSARLVAYRRALWLRSRSMSALGLDEAAGTMLDSGHHVVSASDLGAQRAAGSALPTLIVCPRFRACHSTRLERLPAGQAVIALMESSCSQAQFKVEGLDLVIDLARRLPCYRLVFSDLDDAVTRIEDAFREALARSS